MQALAPWDKQTSPEDVRAGVYWTIETLRVAGTLLSPFMPERMAVLLATVGVPPPLSSSLKDGERSPEDDPTEKGTQSALKNARPVGTDVWTDIRNRRPEIYLTLTGNRVPPLFTIPAEDRQ